MTEGSPDQTTVGHDVFVSYASQDAAMANSIVENLEGKGLKCWIAPRNVRPGAQYADAIVRAIAEANTVVLVLSASAVASAHVAREVERAASKTRPVIPFRLDNAALNPELEYFLSNSQWIDVSQLGMPTALTKLAVAVGHVSTTVVQAIHTDRRPVGLAKRIGVAAGVIIALGVAIVLGTHFLSSNHSDVPTAAAITDKSIAVLPFTDMSEKKDQEYFADGMAEEIIDLLVKVPGLKVISRTSSFQFKGKTEDLRSIATQLGVAYVLEGSVRKSGDHLRVTAQLIDSKDGTHVFSQTYDRDLSDVLKMQDEIAVSLVRALQIEVGQNNIDSRPALRNTEAYTLYLQGMHASSGFDQAGMEQAISDFERVLELDPSFAPAEVGLGDAYFVLGLYGFMPPAIAYEKARLANQRALKLDGNLALAHAQLADIYRVYDGDRAATDRELTKALALAPTDGNMLFYAAGQSIVMGRLEEALKQMNLALAQDPLNPSRYQVLSLIQARRGRLEEAEAAARRGLEIVPAGPFGHYLLGDVLLLRSQADAALTEFSKETVVGARFDGSARAYFAMGRKADSDATLAKLIKDQANRPFDIARVYAFRGETDQAIKWLDQAYAQKDRVGLSIIKTDPMFEKLEGDPRYKAFLKKMNLPE